MPLSVLHERKGSRERVGKRAQNLRLLALQPLEPAFVPQNATKDEKRTTTLQCCALASTYPL